MTVVCCWIVLGDSNGVVEVAVAVAVRLVPPAAVTRVTMSIRTSCSGASVPKVHVTVPVACEHAGFETEMKVTPPGRATFSSTPSAAVELLTLLTWTEYVSCCVAGIGSSESCSVSTSISGEACACHVASIATRHASGRSVALPLDMRSGAVAIRARR
jgi:hypothetical protein